ncbi:MAG: hypothetical protein LBI28_06740 [Treponema sp.]|jgi:hypothetical protein|nr:hypothetical protein [Treponema sp.]
MDFFRVMIDFGKRKRFACGCLAEITEYKRTLCPVCGIERVTPNYQQMFKDKKWNMKIFMDREHYADFLSSQIRGIVSEKTKKILIENFNNAVDFGNIEMISFRDLTEQKLQEIRNCYGYAAVKKIPNDPPQYYRLLLKQGAELDFQKTNIELTVDCSKCGRKRYATPGCSYHEGTPYIIESTWKGYDIFYIEGMGNTVFCTERFIEIYNQNKLTGLEFEKVQTV